MPHTVSPLNTPPGGGAYYQLNRRQQVFVDQLALNGGNILEAYRNAGYIAEGVDSEKASAWRLAARQDVKRAFLEVVRGRAAAHAPDVIRILKDIAGDAKATMNTRVKAAQALAEIIGLNEPPPPQQLNVEVRLTRQEYEKLAVTLLGQMDPKDLKVIEAEFTEIKDGHSESDRSDDRHDEAPGPHPDRSSGPMAPGEGASGGGQASAPEADQRDLSDTAGTGADEEGHRDGNDLRPPAEIEPWG